MPRCRLAQWQYTKSLASYLAPLDIHTHTNTRSTDLDQCRSIDVIVAWLKPPYFLCQRSRQRVSLVIVSFSYGVRRYVLLCHGRQLHIWLMSERCFHLCIETASSGIVPIVVLCFPRGINFCQLRLLGGEDLCNSLQTTLLYDLTVCYRKRCGFCPYCMACKFKKIGSGVGIFNWGVDRAYLAIWMLDFLIICMWWALDTPHTVMFYVILNTQVIVLNTHEK